MPMQITLMFFEGSQLRAWAETHYDPLASSVAGRYLNFTDTGVTPTNLLNQWIQKRMALVPSPSTSNFPGRPLLERIIKSSFLGKIRFSLLTPNVPGGPGNPTFRQSYTLYPATNAIAPYPGWSGTYTIPGVPSTPVYTAEPYTRLLVRLVTNAPVLGSINLGALPENQISPEDTYAPTDDWRGLLSDYISFLASTELAIRTRRVGTQPQNPVVPITTLQIDALGKNAQLAPVTLQPGGLVVPLRGLVIISGRHPSEWNGVHRYLLNTPPPGAAPFLQLGPAKHPLGDWVPSTGAQGFVQLYQPQFPVLAPQYTDERIISRDTGGPFVRYRGRRTRSD